MVNAEFFPLPKMCVIYYDPLIHELRNSEISQYFHPLICNT